MKGQTPERLMVASLAAGLLAMLGAARFHPPAAAREELEQPSAKPVEFTAAEVEAFLEDFLPEQMAELQVPGLVFVLVQDGETTLARGFGYADREREIAFDPERTIIRAGSIVKTITATALMQLAEQGQIDLDQDINTYLTSLQVPPTYSDPITTRQLLHYTGGLDARFIGIRVKDPAELVPLAEYFAERLPPRTRPPGVIRAYHDHEIALAGLVLEEAAGVPYEEFVQQNILEPLEMQSTSFLLPEDQVDRVAIGYGADGPYPLDYYYLNNAAGAGVNTTALDLANFMIMHLQGGSFGDRQVLAPSTVQEMHSTGFTHHPELPGIAYTFDEVPLGDLRILAKGGGAPGFMNRMLLMPDQGVGIFFSYNRDSSVNLRGRLEDALMERFFSPAAVEIAVDPIPNAAARAERYVGYYQDLTDLSKTTVEKISQLTNQIRVTANEDGTLNLFGGQIVEVEPGLFRWTDDGGAVAFAVDDTGEVSYLFVSRSAFERVPWYGTAPVQMALAASAALAFLSGAVAWVSVRLRGSGDGRHLSGAVSLLGLAFLVGFAILFAPLATSPDPPWQFSFDPSLGLRVILGLTLPLAALVAVLVIANLRDWIRGSHSTITRLHESLIALAGVGFVFFLHSWNLLGWRF